MSHHSYSVSWLSGSVSNLSSNNIGYVFRLHGETVSNLPIEGGKFKDSTFTCGQDGFLALLAFYMKEQKELKPDLGISLKDFVESYLG